MAEYIVQGETLTSIADAIRTKTGKGYTMTPSEMASEIAGIEAGGGSGGVQTCTVHVTSKSKYETYFHYIDEEGVDKSIYCDAIAETTFTVPAKTTLVANSTIMASGATMVSQYGIYVNEDCNITLQ